MFKKNFVTRIVTLVSFIIILLQVGMGIWMLKQYEQQQRMALNERITDLRKELRSALVESIWNLDTKWASDFVTDRMEFKPFVGSQFVAADGSELFKLAKVGEKILPESLSGNFDLEIKDSIQHENETIARFSLFFSEKQLQSNVKHQVIIFAIGIGAIASLIILILWLSLLRGIATPIHNTTRSLEDIAAGQGDLTQRLDATRKDQIGTMSKWFNAFVEKIQKQIKSIAQDTKSLYTSSANMQKAAADMNQNARKMSEQLKDVNSATTQSSQNLLSINDSVQQISQALTGVSGTVNLMKNSIQQVTQSSRDDARIANDANLLAENAREVLDRLGQSTIEIGKMVDVIQDIADQTNLLALNATIEASSAGDAGKGFTVVANEVKELARQTTKATEEVSAQVRNIRSAAEESASVLVEITQSIHKIHEGTSEIVSSLESQQQSISDVNGNLTLLTGHAKEIAGNVNTSSKQISSAAQNVEKTYQLAQELLVSVESVRKESSAIGGLSNSLTAVANQFRT